MGVLKSLVGVLFGCFDVFFFCIVRCVFCAFLPYDFRLVFGRQVQGIAACLFVLRIFVFFGSYEHPMNTFSMNNLTSRKPVIKAMKSTVNNAMNNAMNNPQGLTCCSKRSALHRRLSGAVSFCFCVQGVFLPWFVLTAGIVGLVWFVLFLMMFQESLLHHVLKNVLLSLQRFVVLFCDVQ